MKNKPKLTPEQIRTLKSMSMYWDEIASRPDHENIAVAELNVMVHAVQSPMQVLCAILKSDTTLNFISPNIPPAFLLPCKKLYSWYITTKLHNSLPYFIGFFTMP